MVKFTGGEWQAEHHYVSSFIPAHGDTVVIANVYSIAEGERQYNTRVMAMSKRMYCLLTKLLEDLKTEQVLCGFVQEEIDEIEAIIAYVDRERES